MNKYLACYLRLSQDDNNVGESNSIVSQREIIKEYIYSSDEFIEAQTLEFVDDGYSGTNFHRPGIKQLFESVKKGEISCIVVKDLSRFGRNYLEVSKYIEQLFPYIGVRFVAVNDNYDSNNHKDTTAEIDVPVRNMINAMYSIDISKKVKSAKHTKIKQGICASAYVIYGYKKDNVDRGFLLIDEPAASVVRQIFQLTLDGNTASQIAIKLNNDNIPTPSEYKNKIGSKRDWNIVQNENNIWKSAPVFRILREERYTGTYIGGMTEAGKLGSNEHLFKPKNEWVRIPNAHPAIITQEQFDKVAGIINRQSKNRTKTKSNRPLYKKVWCAKCGHLLHYRGDTSYPFYFCDTVRYSDEYGCMKGKIREKNLNETVLLTLLTQINVFVDTKKLDRMVEKTINKPNISTENSIIHFDAEIKTIQFEKRKLYERYTNKEINQTIYLKERENLERELANKPTKRDSLVSEKQSYENMLESVQEFSKIFLQYKSTTELTKEIVDKFIDAVKVYDVDRITIKFAFQDELDRIMKIIN